MWGRARKDFMRGLKFRAGFTAGLCGAKHTRRLKGHSKPPTKWRAGEGTKSRAARKSNRQWQEGARSGRSIDMGLLDWIKNRGKTEQHPEPEDEPAPDRYVTKRGNPIKVIQQGKWQCDYPGYESKTLIGRSIE